MVPVARFFAAVIWRLMVVASWLLYWTGQQVVEALHGAIKSHANVPAAVRDASPLVPSCSPPIPKPSIEASQKVEETIEEEILEEPEAVAEVAEAAEASEVHEIADVEEVEDPEETEETEESEVEEEEREADVKKVEEEAELDEVEGEVSETEMGDDFVVQLLFLRRPVDASVGAAMEAWQSALAQVRCHHSSVRLSMELEDECPRRVAVLGPGNSTRAACRVLAAYVDIEMESECLHHFFAVHFTVRVNPDLPQDDELLDVSLENDWVDLGSVADAEPASSSVGDSTRRRSHKAVLLSRLRTLLMEKEGLHVFTDTDSLCSTGPELAGADIVGALEPEAWQAASKTILACEAAGVYLSRHYDALFWCPGPLREAIQDHVASALSHWKGRELSLGSGFGLSDSSFNGFEDLAANIDATLLGAAPPGWHRGFQTATKRCPI